MSDTDYATMSRDRAEALVRNEVYKAALVLERLEGAGRVRGNGHHAAQIVAEKAVEELRDRWISAPALPPEVPGDSQP